jgi:predicted acetyltransferase
MGFFSKIKPEGCENMGTLWREPEVAQLLEEVKSGQTYDQIAKAHKRTPGGIISRLKDIAYECHNKQMPINEIVLLTSISKNDVIDTIIQKDKCKENMEKRKEKQTTVFELSSKTKPVSQTTSISSEIAELKNEVLSLKKDIKEILRLMNALYDFESQ